MGNRMTWNEQEGNKHALNMARTFCKYRETQPLATMMRHFFRMLIRKAEEPMRYSDRYNCKLNDAKTHPIKRYILTRHSLG